MNRTALPGLLPPPPIRPDPPDHLCSFPGCKGWGAFGFGLHRGAKRWLCDVHRAEGAKVEVRT